MKYFGDNSLAKLIALVKDTLAAHTDDASIHVTAAEKEAWNGAATVDDVLNEIRSHNRDEDAHKDIREEIAALPGKPQAVLVTLRAASWDTTAKTQVAAVTCVVADEAAQMIHPMPKIGQITDYNNAGIQLIGQGEGNVTFMCDVVPEKDLAVWVVTEDVEDVTPPPPPPKIYGVEWDWTSSGPTKGVRTDSAVSFGDPNPAVSNGSGSSPFDDKMPWAGMVVEDDAKAGKLVKIPKFWYKWTQNGNSLKLQIADGPQDGFHVSPAHMDRGDGKSERDFVYIGRYHCASGYKSQAGSRPLGNMTRSQARTNIHNLGADYWQSDIQMRITIWMLYLVEFADWNSQKTIGYGCSSSNSMFNMGMTDAMQYHTGTTAASRTTYGCTQYRYIESLWDNAYDWMDGCYYNGSGLNIINTPNKFHDASNGVAVGIPADGWPSAFTVSNKSGLEWVIYPTAVGGRPDTYSADRWSFYTGYPCLCVGGCYSQDQTDGLFRVNYYAASGQDTYVGCRLQKLP